ncbi:MAG: ATP-binding protein [Bacteroidota bacterium]
MKKLPHLTIPFFSSSTRWSGFVSWGLLLAIGAGLTWWTQDGLALAYWLIGHLIIGLATPRLDQISNNSRTLSPWQRALLAAAIPSLLFIIVQQCILATKGWRGFLHLSDLPWQVWGYWLALLPMIVGSWLIGLRQVQLLKQQLSDSKQRIGLLVGSALLFAFLDFTPLLTAGYVPLALSLTVFLITLDVYLDNERSSMTWLLLWWLLTGLLLGWFAHRQSLHIDQRSQQVLAKSIVQNGQPDTTLRYHLPFQWDTLSPVTATERLSGPWLSLAPGTGQQRIKDGRTDWIFHRADQQGFIIVGRNYGGFRPIAALVSLIFLGGLAYSLLLRMSSWALRYPYERWLLPVFGPFTLRMRIQLAFFVLVLVAFFLVTIFTIDFFRDETALYDTWLEQLLGLYASLLLVAGALGLLLANSISDPIVQIGQKLSNTQLQDNEPLQWPRQDEIGRLVQNYNQMILALDESAERLAASERESAWREMAKQVAHEIKNPLTPMKLQLQQLLRLEKDDPERAREWSSRIAKGMIEQIDGLARIATAFSHFARLPAAQLTQFDLREVLQSVAQLHQISRGEIQLCLPPDSCLVEADRDQIVRVLNNLIRNAVQATEQTDQAELHLRLQAQEANYQIEVQDNGSGIPPAIQARIFQPNFTTKSSGMGLGLAMCKNIIEQAGGNIQFTTRPNIGTTFTLTLPKLQDS